VIQLLFEIYEMKRNLDRPREEVDKLRLQLLKSQIENAYENVPFYENVFTRLGLHPNDFKALNDLKKLPIITKEDVQKNTTQFMSKRFEINQCRRSHTSGSTGQPSWTYYDKKFWIRKKYLSKLRARMTCGMKLGEKVIIFESDPPQKLQERNKKFYFQTPFLKITFFSIFNDVTSTLSHLVKLNPQNMYGPPSYFFQLAQAMKKANIKLNLLKRIFTSSEYLEMPIKRYLEKTFGVNVFDIYGSTEFKEVAWQCEIGRGYHVNEDDVICEVLKGEEPAGIGEVGDIVLTDLRNQAMPLIRYRIKDKGRLLEEKCPCGLTFSLMQPVAGRASEYIELPDGTQLSPYLFTTSIEKVPGLLQYQIIQKTKRELVVKVIIELGQEKKGAHEAQQILNRVTKGTMNVQVEICEKIIIEANGKYKVVKNLVNA